MKKYFLPIILSLFFIGLTLGGAEAQSTTASISGDEVCGSTFNTRCTIGHLSTIVRGVLALVLSVGLPLLFVFIAFRVVMAWFALQQGNAGAYNDALKKAGNAILGFLAIVAIFGGLLLVMLQYLGVRGDAQFNPLQILRIFSEAFFTHAYAQTPGTYLPNPIGVNNLYDFLLSVLRLVMRFFVYPALIVIWVWTGFSFVAAQGKPEALAKARKWFMWAVITTFIIFFLQTFLIALRGTVQRILPASQNTIPVTSSGVDGRVAPELGQAGAACTTETGVVGIMGGGVCNPSRGAGSSNTAGYCTNLAIGTLCTVRTAGGSSISGTCSNNSEGVKGCYASTQGTACISASGAGGTMNAQGVCVLGGRTTVGRGGSCRISLECGSDGLGQMSCNSNGVCE